MTMENFTQKAQQAISESQQLALKNHNQQVDGEHLHAALLDQSDGLIPRLMQLIGVDASRYKADVDALVDEFIAKLQASGSQRIVDEAQAQLTAWRASVGRTTL